MKAEALRENTSMNKKSGLHENAGKRAVIDEIYTCLTEHFEEPFKADDLAAMFHISRSYMMHAFKYKYYISINDYLISLRISDAKRMLHMTDATITEIANQCGFHTLSYFEKIFREKEGVKPTEYREKCRKILLLRKMYPRRLSIKAMEE